MARKNRVVVENGNYHLTSRIAHRQFLLTDEIKEKIVIWMYGIADFCGVNVLAWNILDNHLHIYVNVPSVPERYWSPAGTVPSSSSMSPAGTVPAAPQPSAFTMRPAECRAPRWTPDMTDRDYAISPAGERPSEDAVLRALAEGVPVVSLPRPNTGFTMSDEEMLERLAGLYAGHSNGAEKIRRRWERLRAEGRNDVVDAEKEALCRRMYNVSRFMQCLKQRISQHFNYRLNHAGGLWDGRFHSGLVDNDRLASAYVSAYIEWNAPRAGIVSHPREWKWCSYHVACGEGPYAERARKGYEMMFGVSWDEARLQMESIFAAKLPDADGDRGGEDASAGERRRPARRVSMAQLIKLHVEALSRGGFISRSMLFVKSVVGMLPKGFAVPSDRSVAILSAYDWTLPKVA